MTGESQLTSKRKKVPSEKTKSEVKPSNSGGGVMGGDSMRKKHVPSNSLGGVTRQGGCLTKNASVRNGDSNPYLKVLSDVGSPDGFRTKTFRKPMYRRVNKGKGGGFHGKDARQHVRKVVLALLESNVGIDLRRKKGPLLEREVGEKATRGRTLLRIGEKKKPRKRTPKDLRQTMKKRVCMPVRAGHADREKGRGGKGAKDTSKKESSLQQVRFT